MIKMEDCVKGHVYECRARSFDSWAVPRDGGGNDYLTYAVFNGRDADCGYIGIRTKFGQRFLFTESHWEAPDFATCAPLVDLGPIPSDILPRCFIGTECHNCKRSLILVPAPDDVYRGNWSHLVVTDCEPRATMRQNDRLFAYLDKMLSEKKADDPRAK